MRQRQLMIGASFLLVFVFATAWAAGARTKVTDDAAIRSIVPNFEMTWTKCDAKALAQLWTEDGDFQSPYASFANGRREIEKFYRDAFDSGYCGSSGTGKIENLRFVQEGVAIIDGAWEIRGAHDQNKQAMPPEQGRFTAIVTKQNGAWRIVAQREMIPAVLK